MVEIFGKDLFNSEFKKDAQHALEDDVKKYNEACENLNNRLEYLQDCRNELSANLRQTETLVDNLKNTPAGFHDKVQKLKVNLTSYQKLLESAETESAKIVQGAGAGAAGGVATGAAVAAFGGPALTALAMSVGTASTGASIAGLSGAAATNAVLAWIGGGSLAAGGSGIAGGEAVLGLFGPLGVAIGGVTLLTTGILANGKNKKAAAEMYSNAAKVEAGIKGTEALTTEIGNQAVVSRNSSEDLQKRVQWARNTWPDNFLEFTDDQVLEAGSLINNALSAEKILNARIGKTGKFEESKDLEKTNFNQPVRDSSATTMIGKVTKFANGQGTILTGDGYTYQFKAFNTYGNVGLGSTVTFSASGDSAKDIYESDESFQTAQKVNQQVTQSTGRQLAGQVVSLDGAEGIIKTTSGRNYSFKLFNTYGDVGLHSTVTFTANGNAAKEIHEVAGDVQASQNPGKRLASNGELVGEVITLNGGAGTILADDGYSYAFKQFNTFGDVRLNSTVAFTVNNGEARNIEVAELI